MFFRKNEDIQRLNLKASAPASTAAVPAPSPTENHSLPQVDPARLEAVDRKAKEILDSGRIPDVLFVCSVGNGLLVLQQGEGDGGQTPVMLLFSHPFGARDYLRATNTTGTVGQLKGEALPRLAQTWISQGVLAVALDRCPRCPQFLSFGLDAVTKWTKEDFAKTWAHLRATHVVCAETRVRSAMAQMAKGSYAAARADLEYVRDHFDCGVPYLHQMIGLLAGMQQDEQAVATAMERLKEFGPAFEGPLTMSHQLFAAASVGLMVNFGIPLPPPPGQSEVKPVA